MATDNLGFPFDSINHDRTMSSASFRKIFRSFFTNGIFNTDDFYVTANNSMNVTVGVGNACINGAFYPVSDNVTLTIDSSNGTFDRYDAIAIEFNLTDRQFYIKAVKGGSDSQYPRPVRTDSVYQLFVAVVKVTKGTTSLTQENVNDLRDDSNYCGYVTSTGSQERFESELHKLKTQINNFNILNTWSTWKSCGENGCGITLKYRYNEASKLVELNWDGSLTNTIVGNSIGYMWEGFPLDKLPKKNVFIPVQTQSTDLTLRFYPKTNDMTANHWTLTSMHGSANVSAAYVCGSFIYSYA
jgi:hypothetical protein